MGFSDICPYFLVFAVKLANFLIFTVSVENTFVFGGFFVKTP